MPDKNVIQEAQSDIEYYTKIIEERKRIIDIVEKLPIEIQEMPCSAVCLITSTWISLTLKGGEQTARQFKLLGSVPKSISCYNPSYWKWDGGELLIDGIKVSIEIIGDEGPADCTLIEEEYQPAMAKRYKVQCNKEGSMA